jgi:hypothetical protein
MSGYKTSLYIVPSRTYRVYIDRSEVAVENRASIVPNSNYLTFGAETLLN